MVFNFRTPSFFYDSPVTENTEELRIFSFKELKAATGNFSHGNLLKARSLGSVFKGRLQDGSLVAITRLNKFMGPIVEILFQKEMEVGRLRIQHPNILSLKGYCRAKKERLLVYPFMINNSLCSYLRRDGQKSGVQPLSWAVRKQIALGVARGLAHLHHYCDPKIIHRRVRPWVILLDEGFEAVIGGFDIALIIHPKDLIHGTVQCPIFGDINVVNWNFTSKNDVFAFGVTLLTLVTGQGSGFIFHPGDEVGRRIPLIDWVRGLVIEQLMDPDLQGNYVYEEAKQLLELGLRCAHDDPRKRPEMLEVVSMIEDLGEAPQFPLSDSRPSATLSRSESDSTVFYSFSSTPTREVEAAS